MKRTMIDAPARWVVGSNGGNILKAPPVVEANEMLQVGRLPMNKTAGTFVTSRPGWSKALVLPARVAAACWDLRA
jgi:hypothetical protein